MARTKPRKPWVHNDAHVNNITPLQGRGLIEAEAALTPSIADGTFAFIAFTASAVSDRDANPTDRTLNTRSSVYKRTSGVETQQERKYSPRAYCR